MHTNQARIDGQSPKELGVFPKLYAALSGFVFLIYFFAPHYAGINLAAGLIFNSADGWCVGSLPVFGPHCFGDFGLGIMMVEKNHQVWTPTDSYPPANYPPATFAIYAFFRLILITFGYSFTIFFYLFALAICVLMPLWFLTKQYSRVDRFFLVMILGTFSVPFLSVLDRGNTVAFLVPCILLTYFGVKTGSERIQIFGMVLAVSLRPQAILLVSILVFQRKYKSALKVISLSLVSNLLIMFAWDHSNFFSNIRYYIASLVGYGNKSIDADFPYNYSLARAVYKILEFIGLGVSTQRLESFASITGYFLIGVLLLTIYVKKVYEIKTLFYIVLVSMFLLAPVTFLYYTVFITLTVAIALDRNTSFSESKVKNSIFVRSTMILLGLTLTPLYVPSPMSPHWNVIQLTVPLLWWVWTITTIFLFAFNRIRAINLDGV
jgi:hypothetical protein